MQILSHPLPLILYLFFAALHFISPALPPLGEKILKYANLALHVMLYFVMMLYRIPLDEVVFLYLFSLLLYVLSALFWQRRRGAGKCSEERDAEREDEK